MPNINREYKLVRADKIRFSTVLPRRDSYDDKIRESMRKDGVQQMLIVRPHPTFAGQYEIIDGSMRRWALKNDDYVVVDVRYDAKDSEVFKISELTFKRKQRSTYQRAEFFSEWVNVIKREFGKKGAQARVAREAGLAEGGISQYLAINRMFTDLSDLLGSSSVSFNALKNGSVNKLYELSRLVGTPVFLDVAGQLAENLNMSVRELRRIVEEETSTEKVLSRLVEEDPFETKHSNKIDCTKIAKLTQEMQSIGEDTGKNLRALVREIERKPERFGEAEVLEELRKLRRRFKRLQKDVTKLPDRLAAKSLLTG